MSEVGEEIVGTWLRYCRGCDFVDYNVGVRDGQGEIDVIGINLVEKEAYVCEVATHIHGLGYKNVEQTILNKFIRANDYANTALWGMPVTYMFWAPVVRRGDQMAALKAVQSGLWEARRLRLELVINQAYVDKMDELRGLAAKRRRDVPHQMFRLLQIEEHAKRYASSLS